MYDTWKAKFQRLGLKKSTKFDLLFVKLSRFFVFFPIFSLLHRLQTRRRAVDGYTVD
jgi:hypothetical protein